MNSSLPNFLCIGAQKSGTTIIHNILKQHPDIFLPEIKEAHFFNNSKRYNKGIEWWLEIFLINYKGEPIIGDMTPDYLYCEDAPQRIKILLGDEPKILIILRNPVDRAYSHYYMSVSKGIESFIFQDAIKNEQDRIQQNEFCRLHYSYISRGLYFEQVKRYLNTFNNKNTLILNFEEDIVDNLANTIALIQSFLEVEYFDLDISININFATRPRLSFINIFINKNNKIKTSLKRFIKSRDTRIFYTKLLNRLNQKPMKYQIPTESRRYLLDKYFLPDIQNLEKLLSIDLSHWKKC